MRHLPTLSLAALLLASCTSIKPQSSKPPSEYGRTDAEIEMMRAADAASRTPSRSNDGLMHTEYQRPYKRGDLALLFGVRSMRNEGAWGPLRSQLAGGINWNWEPSGSLLGFDTSFFYSTDSSDVQTAPNTYERIQGENFEFSMGGIKSLYLGSTPLRAYLGAGVAFVGTRLERYDGAVVRSGNDYSFAGYGRVGLVYQIAWDGHIGFDYRALVGTSNDILGHSFDSDYDQFTFNFGTSF